MKIIRLVDALLTNLKQTPKNYTFYKSYLL